MGGGLSALASSLSSATDDDLPVADPDKCQHKFCEKWGPGHYHCADCHSTIQDETLIASEDAIIDSIVDESVAEDGVYRGVSIQFLVDFATTCNCWDMTTRDVRRRFVMPATRASRCRFVELPEMQQSPQKYVGRAGTFVSHTWGARFGDLVAALCDGGADRSRYVWVDIFAVRQWPSRKPDLDFSAVVRQCGSFVIVCSALPEVSKLADVDIVIGKVVFPAHVRNQIAFLRVWCLVEVHSALLSGAAIVMKGGRLASSTLKDDVVQFVSDSKMLANLAYMVDIESADATVASDKERILSGIRESVEGVDAVNRAVRGAITGSMLSDPLVQCAACDDQMALAEILKSPSEYIVSAAGSGYVKLLQKLLDCVTDTERLQAFTPALDAATMGGNVECVSLLLKNGCPMEDKAKLITSAATYGHTAVVGLLLDHGCDINALDTRDTPLTAACLHGHAECVKLLLERGADKDVGVHGMSALVFAAAGGRPHIVRLLINSGVNPTSESHRDAVGFAASSGSVECLDLLIKSGCDVHCMVDGLTLLMMAAEEGRLACLEYLLNAGCRVDAQDKNGKTALDLARTRGHTDCVELLLKPRMDASTASA